MLLAAEPALNDRTIEVNGSPTGVEIGAAVSAAGCIHAAHLHFDLLPSDLAQLVVGERRITQEINPVDVATRRLHAEVQDLQAGFLQVVAFFGGNSLCTTVQNLAGEIH